MVVRTAALGGCPCVRLLKFGPAPLFVRYDVEWRIAWPPAGGNDDGSGGGFSIYRLNKYIFLDDHKHNIHKNMDENFDSHERSGRKHTQTVPDQLGWIYLPILYSPCCL